MCALILTRGGEGRAVFVCWQETTLTPTYSENTSVVEVQTVHTSSVNRRRLQSVLDIAGAWKHEELRQQQRSESWCASSAPDVYFPWWNYIYYTDLLTQHFSVTRDFWVYLPRQNSSVTFVKIGLTHWTWCWILWVKQLVMGELRIAGGQAFLRHTMFPFLKIFFA